MPDVQWRLTGVSFLDHDFDDDLVDGRLLVWANRSSASWFRESDISFVAKRSHIAARVLSIILMSIVPRASIFADRESGMESALLRRECAPWLTRSGMSMPGCPSGEWITPGGALQLERTQ